jgi:hypothetical protein
MMCRHDFLPRRSNHNRETPLQRSSFVLTQSPIASFAGALNRVRLKTLRSSRLNRQAAISVKYLMTFSQVATKSPGDLFTMNEKWMTARRSGATAKWAEISGRLGYSLERVRWRHFRVNLELPLVAVSASSNDSNAEQLRREVTTLTRRHGRSVVS